MEEFNKRMDREFEKRLEGLGLSQQPRTMVQDYLPPLRKSALNRVARQLIYRKMTLAQLANANYMLSIILLSDSLP